MIINKNSAWPDNVRRALINLMKLERLGRIKRSETRSSFTALQNSYITTTALFFDCDKCKRRLEYPVNRLKYLDEALAECPLCKAKDDYISYMNMFLN